MKRTIIAASVLALGFAGAGVSVADPGPHHGNNARGLCTAYFSGSDNGKENKRKAGPFAALEEAADEAGDGNGSATEEEVAAFCDAATGGVYGNNGRGGGQGGGN